MNGHSCKNCKDRLLLFVVTFVATISIGCAAEAPPDEVHRIVELLHLQPGMRVADVGAGDGEWAEALARVVGERGHVYATEIKEDLVDEIRERMEDAGLANVSAVLGDDEHSGLPAGCCDAILLRLVYHHFTDPESMRADLRRALRPGAPMVIIDIVPQTHWSELPGVPDRGGHGIPLDMLVEEISADGFEVIERFDEWPGDEDHFCAVVRARPSTGDPVSKSGPDG